MEVDEFWTYVGSKGKKQWLIYCYHRENESLLFSNFLY
ncbi:MAG: IS1 family transposase [Chitinophagaceae bacterium]|nr:IS1 family transposase [Chitinophagaceae bacterium]